MEGSENHRGDVSEPPDGNFSMSGSRLRASTPSDGPPRKILRHVLVRLNQIPGSRVSTSIIHRRYGVDEA